MTSNNGFFGNIQGPFAANEELFTRIQTDCNKTINYISKLGVHYIGNFDLIIQKHIDEENQLIETDYPQFIIKINNIEFQLGKTKMLELQDVRITSIKFNQDVNDNFYIDYQYK